MQLLPIGAHEYPLPVAHARVNLDRVRAERLGPGGELRLRDQDDSIAFERIVQHRTEKSLSIHIGLGAFSDGRLRHAFAKPPRNELLRSGLGDDEHIGFEDEDDSADRSIFPNELHVPAPKRSLYA